MTNLKILFGVIALFFVACELNPCPPIDCFNGGAFNEDNCECVCPFGFSGDRCEVANNPCGSITCENGGTCITALGKCDCLEGYTGESCEIKLATACDNIACENGGTCNDGICDCLENFSGDNCEIYLCEDVNCLNGGTCKEGVCECLEGYEGEDCSIEIVVDHFIAEWYADDDCGIGAPTEYCATFEKTGDTYRIKNFGGDGDLNKVTIDAGVDITIPEQTYGIAKVSGSGTLSPDKKSISIQYHIIQEALYLEFYCMGEWTKK